MKTSQTNNNLLRKLGLAVLCAAMPLSLQAESAAYEQGVLTLPLLKTFQEGLPILLEDVTLLLNDSEFEAQLPMSARPASVQSMSMDESIRRGELAYVHVEGFKSLGCIRLKLALTRQNKDFYLTVDEQPVFDAAHCRAGRADFRFDLEIDTTELRPGAYTVNSQGLRLPFQVTAF